MPLKFYSSATAGTTFACCFLMPHHSLLFFAASITGSQEKRYLWTDAYGVCNYITLACETGDASYLNAADALIADVHGAQIGYC